MYADHEDVRSSWVELAMTIGGCILAGIGIAVLLMHFVKPAELPATKAPVPIPVQLIIEISKQGVLASGNEITEDDIPYIAAVPNRATVDRIAKVLYIEARGSSHAVKRGYAAVMWHRGDGDPKAIVREIESREWNGRYGQYLIRTTHPDKRSHAWADCYQIAYEMVDGTFIPPFRANMVHALKAKPRSWTGMRFVVKVGRSKFYYNPKLG